MGSEDRAANCVRATNPNVKFHAGRLFDESVDQAADRLFLREKEEQGAKQTNNMPSVIAFLRKLYSSKHL